MSNYSIWRISFFLENSILVYFWSCIFISRIGTNICMSPKKLLHHGFKWQKLKRVLIDCIIKIIPSSHTQVVVRNKRNDNVLFEQCWNLNELKWDVLQMEEQDQTCTKNSNLENPCGITFKQRLMYNIDRKVNDWNCDNW